MGGLCITRSNIYKSNKKHETKEKIIIPLKPEYECSHCQPQNRVAFWRSLSLSWNLHGPCQSPSALSVLTWLLCVVMLSSCSSLSCVMAWQFCLMVLGSAKGGTDVLPSATLPMIHANPWPGGAMVVLHALSTFSTLY